MCRTLTGMIRRVERHSSPATHRTTYKGTMAALVSMLMALVSAADFQQSGKDTRHTAPKAEMSK